MNTTVKALGLAAAVLLTVAGSSARAEAPHHAPTQFLPIQNEPAPKLHVEQPIPGPLASRGTVIIPYRTENFRILPIFGPGARDVSPRAGHLHITVNDLPWHWADAGGTGAIVLAGLSPGVHKVLIELATPEHHVITGQTVSFTVPEVQARHH